MARFASPYAEKIWDGMERHGTGSKKVVRLDSFHTQCEMRADDFDRGLTWLIHFNFVRKFTTHGRTMIERV